MDPVPLVNPVPDTASEITTPPNPIMVPLEPSRINKRTILKIALILGLVLLVLGATYYFLVFRNKPKVTENTSQEKETAFHIPKYWINCDDVRQIIEEGNTLYAGCLGGVLVVDKNTGEVKDQLSMANGLGDMTAGSLVKKGDVLYVGSQDGITIFNLKTREAKKISVKEGLVNGANIKLAEDGNKIWIATFDGVSLLDTTKDTVVNYKTELDNQAERVNITDLLVTSKYVYFSEVASTYSSGAIIRYDKATGLFTTFRVDSFGRNYPYARLDFSSIALFGNKVYVSDYKEMFEIDETSGATWKKVDSAPNFIKKDLSLDTPVLRLLKNSDPKGPLLYAGSKIYRYNFESDTTEVYFDFGKLPVRLVNSSAGSTVWYKYFNNGGIWVGVLDLPNKKTSDFSLKDRPENFSQLLALIDDEPLVYTNVGLYKYSLDQGKFVKLFDGLSRFDNSLVQLIFQPLPETNQVFILGQECGQGCNKPVFYIYNYNDGTNQELMLSSDVDSLGSSGMGGHVSYAALTFSWRDLAEGNVGLSYFDNVGEKYLVYNYKSQVWSTSEKIPVGADVFDPKTGVGCNMVYTFKTNGNKFGGDGCTGKATDGTLSWKMSSKNEVLETHPKTGLKTLNVPVLEPKYSPFGWDDSTRLSKLIYAKGKLWMASNRGLVSYDPVASSYKIYGPSEGLLSKDITSYLVGKYLWVNSNWGGLSVIAE